MEIRVIKYFLAVAKLGNITKAANALHLTQPTLSRQLQDLEYELGHALFNRKGGLSLTAEGQRFRIRAEQILELVNRTKAEIKDSQEDITGDVYIGAGESRSISILTSLMKELTQKHPKLRFHFVSGDSVDLLDRLDKGLLDFCVLIQPINLEKYEHLNLGRKDTYGIMLRKDDALANKEYFTLDDVKNLPLIVSRQAIKNEYLDNPILNWFQGNYDNLNIVGTYNLLYNAAIMTEDQLGYTLCLDRIVKTTMDSDLIFKPLSPKLEVEVSFAWKKDQVLSNQANLFLEALKEKIIK